MFRLQKIPGNNTVAIVGDSFDVRSMVISSANRAIYPYGIWQLTNMLMCQKLDFVYIDGVNGTGALSGSTHYSSRIDAAIASGAQYIAIRASINDFNDLIDYNLLIAEYSSLFAKVNASGMTVISNSVAPSNGYIDTSRRSNWIAFNKWILGTAPKLFDIIVLPQHYQAIDHTSLTGTVDLAMAADGGHPDLNAAFLIAEDSVRVLEPYFYRNNNILYATMASGVADASLLDVNPTNIGTGGTLGSNVTGAVADGYGIRTTSNLGTVVASKVARTDGPGYWQQIVWTPSASDQYLEYYSLGNGVPLATGGAVIGDTLQSVCEVELDIATAPADAHYPVLKLTHRGGVGYSSGFALNATMVALNKSGWRGVVSTPKMDIPASTTEIQLSYGWTNKTSGPQTIRFGQHCVVNHSR